MFSISHIFTGTKNNLPDDAGGEDLRRDSILYD